MGAKVYHDIRGDQPCEITTFLHCRDCLVELPSNESPRSYQRIQVGITNDGSIQVWCVRHDKNIDVMGSKPRPGLRYPK